MTTPATSAPPTPSVSPVGLKGSSIFLRVLGLILTLAFVAALIGAASYLFFLIVSVLPFSVRNVAYVGWAGFLLYVLYQRHTREISANPYTIGVRTWYGQLTGDIVGPGIHFEADYGLIKYGLIFINGSIRDFDVPVLVFVDEIQVSLRFQVAWRPEYKNKEETLKYVIFTGDAATLYPQDKKDPRGTKINEYIKDIIGAAALKSMQGIASFEELLTKGEDVSMTVKSAVEERVNDADIGIKVTKTVMDTPTISEEIVKAKQDIKIEGLQRKSEKMDVETRVQVLETMKKALRASGKEVDEQRLFDLAILIAKEGSTATDFVEHMKTHNQKEIARIIANALEGVSETGIAALVAWLSSGGKGSPPVI